MTPSRLVTAGQRVVIKAGSAQLMDLRTGEARLDRFQAIAAGIPPILAPGGQVVLVSSGAVALGRSRLSFGAGARLTLEQKQAAAAIGQARLIQLWDQALSPHGLMAAQALLSPSDTESRPRWLNARNTLETLLGCGVIPVINENDTVATEELRFGDNDRLAARTAQLVGARLLVILSDVDGLYDRDPSLPGAVHIDEVPVITPAIEALAGPARANSAGTGGMASKIAAARIAMAAGCAVVITSGEFERPLTALEGGARATWFKPQGSPESARRIWITGMLAQGGRLHVDEGAFRAVLNRRNLLPAGVRRVDGVFRRGEAVRLRGPDGKDFATGIAGYDGEEARRIAGLNSRDVETVLGYRRGAALVHADDLVLDASMEGPPDEL